jgi:hypothetical protein
MRKLILVLIAGVCLTLTANAQRQQALYIDNGSGVFTKITATGAGGTLNLPSAGTLLTTATGMANPMSALGDMIYENSTPIPAKLAGNTHNYFEVLGSTGVGGVAQAPAWSTIVTDYGLAQSIYVGGAGNALSTGTLNTGVGFHALSAPNAGLYNTAIGCFSLPQGPGAYNTAVGFASGQAISSGNGNIILGPYSGNITTNVSNTFMAGGNQSTGLGITNVYFGDGDVEVLNHTPDSYTIHGTGGNGTNIAGGSITIAGGIATGNATPGNIVFQTSTVGATGTTAQTLSTVGTFSPTALGLNVPITSGTWQGSLIGPTYGGTGVNNGTNTITLGGTLTTTVGSVALAADAGGSSSVTLPASGTLATTSQLPAAGQVAFAWGTINAAGNLINGSYGCASSTLSGTEYIITLNSSPGTHYMVMTSWAGGVGSSMQNVNLNFVVPGDNVAGWTDGSNHIYIGDYKNDGSTNAHVLPSPVSFVMYTY